MSDALDSDRGKFVNISLFGSMARGTNDEISDLDIIAIVHDGGGTQPATHIMDWARKEHKMRPSISWYGERKIRSFFEAGDLFAWHLYLESRPILGHKNISHKFGKPKPLLESERMIGELIDILEEIPENLERSPRNSIFEAGVAYVCLRNIGMAASWRLGPRPDFTRYSPYNILNLYLPIPKHMYDIFSRCRIAGQRGGPAPNLSSNELRKWLPCAIDWARRVRNSVT